MSKIETCKSCRFWLADPDGGTDNSPDREGPAVDPFLAFGKCRRLPPVISDHMAAIAIGQVGFGGNNPDPEDIANWCSVHNSCLWPVTYYTSWCGEYRREKGR